MPIGPGKLLMADRDELLTSEIVCKIDTALYYYAEFGKPDKKEKTLLVIDLGDDRYVCEKVQESVRKLYQSVGWLFVNFYHKKRFTTKIELSMEEGFHATGIFECNIY